MVEIIIKSYYKLKKKKKKKKKKNYHRNHKNLIIKNSIRNQSIHL